jgi:hypothetical protein
METDLNNMTMRDFFAALVMIGANAASQEKPYMSKMDLALDAYDYADAMIIARETDDAS